MPRILLLNFLCTDSIEIMSFFNVGDHSGLLYFKIGRAYVMKALTNKSRSFETKQRWIKLARWWALQVIVSICWLKLEYDSSITPRSDTVSDTDICLFSYIPLRKARCVLFYFTIWVWFGQFSSKIVPSIQAANTVLYATTELWKAQNVDSG